MRRFKNFIIKALGGYTKKEYNRVERKYQGLLDSKTDSVSSILANESMMKILGDLDKFAKNELYGNLLDTWTSRMFNVIHNNYLRIMIRYVHPGSTSIYRLDTTLDTEKGFANILKEENNSEDLFILENNDWEV